MILDTDNWQPIDEAPWGAKFDCELLAADGEVYRGAIYGTRTQFRMAHSKSNGAPLTHYRAL